MAKRLCSECNQVIRVRVVEDTEVRSIGTGMLMVTGGQREAYCDCTSAPVTTNFVDDAPQSWHVHEVLKELRERTPKNG